MLRKFLISLSFLFCIGNNLIAQNFYSIDTIQKIEITFSQFNWDYILDTAKLGADTYTLAQNVKINGTVFDSVGVKYKGNSSFNPNNTKNPFHIELDHFKNHSYQGFTDIKLSNGFNDPSLIRETLTYALLRQYMHASEANFAQVYVNAQYIGVYTNVEAVTKKFVDKHFYSKDNSFFYADNGGCNLTYKGPDSTVYFNNYTLKSQYGWNDLKNLCNTLKNNIPAIETILDVDRALWMIAYTNTLVILDSYIGSSTHNYYIYRDQNGRFNPIIWDLNGAFGVFNSPHQGQSYTVTQMQNMSPLLHLNDSLWPLVNKLLAVPRYKRMYIAHMKTIVNENFANGSYTTTGNYMQSVADTAVQSDPNKFFSHAQYLNNMNNNIVSGPKTIPGLTLLMNARTSFLNATPEFQLVAPTVANVQASDTFPPINSNVFITAQVYNAVSVFLGYRSNLADRFVRINMFDDGMHGDAAAGDGVYGIGIPVNTQSLQYYIYAENNNAGIFDPVRAEHEYHSLNINYATVQAGQVVINEIMALNNTTVQNGNGTYSDWIEMYNTTSGALSLEYMYLSDDAANLQKWKFPAGVSIPANAYQIIWADNETYPGELHCGFKFAGSGEQVYLSYPNGYVIDSVSYGIQTADITYGRYPNGTGAFVFMPPTFNATNTITSIETNLSDKDEFIIYPNPSTGIFYLHDIPKKDVVKNIEVFNYLGENIRNFQISNIDNLSIDLSDKPAGIYLVRLNSENHQKTIRIIKQ